MLKLFDDLGTENLNLYYAHLRHGGTRMKESGESHGIRRLIALFLAFKILLFLIACASPGFGYDTSTQILFDQYGPRSNSWIANALEHVAVRLTRWDGIYFATLAERGHINEQDWAFSWVLARVTDGTARCAS